MKETTNVYVCGVIVLRTERYNGTRCTPYTVRRTVRTVRRTMYIVTIEYNRYIGILHKSNNNKYCYYYD